VTKQERGQRETQGKNIEFFQSFQILRKDFPKIGKSALSFAKIREDGERGRFVVPFYGGDRPRLP
jgi:hypothetical protein